MPVLLITFDSTDRPSLKQHNDILSVIKQSHNWARLSETSYAMDTDQSPHHVYTKLKTLLGDADRVLIATLQKPYYGLHKRAVIDWLDQKLSYPTEPTAPMPVAKNQLSQTQTQATA